MSFEDCFLKLNFERRTGIWQAFVVVDPDMPLNVVPLVVAKLQKSFVPFGELGEIAFAFDGDLMIIGGWVWPVSNSTLLDSFLTLTSEVVTKLGTSQS